ncbi:uncharacterized protein LOC143144465 [Ptiloglossa arizonensis]|uniref:uncharacterized protein LOC143144465 n=1 Tax=Ptiloglossa arizonensis TaxID=3350558 RepID=UPI003FA1446F
MKYSPQQQQQKERKLESEVCSIDATPKRGARRHSTSTDCKTSSSLSARSTVCGTPSTGMFAWMRVFRLATMLHQVGC